MTIVRSTGFLALTRAMPDHTDSPVATRSPVTALVFGTYDAGTHPRIQVLIDGLRIHGLTVREVNAPLGLSTAERVGILRQPWRLPKLVARLAARWTALMIGARREGRIVRPDFVLVGYLGHFDVLLARVLFPRTTIVLDHLIFAAGTATDRGAGTRGRARLLSILDWLALRAASVTVVDTEEHRSMVPARLRANCVVVPVGATQTWFDASREGTDAGNDRLSVVFFGLFTPLQGTPVIGAALRILHERGVSLRATLIGSGQEFDAVRAQLASVPGVTWHAWVEARTLPGRVADHDVCLGIFGDTAKAMNVVPNKVYQGAAAGCAVVTSDTGPQRRVLEGAAVLVPAADPVALADALEALANDEQVVADLKRRARALAEREFSAASVVRPLVTLLGISSGAGPGGAA